MQYRTYMSALPKSVPMGITTMTSREFNRDVSKAKRRSSEGPVFITDRGRPAHVLMTVENYHKMVGEDVTIVDLLALPDAPDIEFEPPRLSDELFKTPDLI